MTRCCSSFLSNLNLSKSNSYFSLASIISSSSDFSNPLAKLICSSVYSSFFISFSASKSGLPPSMISVPLPAIFVAIVTIPWRPASATISASFSCCLAFNTLCLTPFLFSIWLISSEFSIEIVPTRTGCPFSFASITLLVIALNLDFSFVNTASCISSRTIGLLVGITTTSMLYMSLNSSSSVLAVPVMPDSFWYILK